MNDRAAQLVDALLQGFPPDMERQDDYAHVRASDGIREEADVRRECYSMTQLMAMLGDQDLVNALCRANEGEPLWKSSVRNFLLGWLA